MLYDPKWEQVSGVASLPGFIAWLETMPPGGKYEWMKCDGTCLIDQYLASIGLKNDGRTDHGSNYFQAQGGGPNGIAVGWPRTYGSALERARAVLAAR